jgi:hypothetical protein
MFKLLAVALVLAGAYAGCLLVGLVLQERAVGEKLAQENAHPASSVAESPRPLTPETER